MARSNIADGTALGGGVCINHALRVVGQRDVALEARGLARDHDTPHAVLRALVVDELNLHLGVAVAAVLKAKRLVLVITGGQHGHVRQVSPLVARSVRRTVDANERSTAKVGVDAPDVRAGKIDLERNADVEPNLRRTPSVRRYPWKSRCGGNACSLTSLVAPLAQTS